MGGLSRKLEYVNTLKRKNIKPIILDAGETLFSSQFVADGALESERFKAKSFLNLFESIGCDALNIGGFDLAGGFGFLSDLQANSTVTFLSANLRIKETGDLAFQPFKVIDRGDLKIGIIGVTNLLPLRIKELSMDNYLEAGKSYILQLRKNVDILVLLVNTLRKDKATILENFSDADYIFLSRPINRTRTTMKPESLKPLIYTLGKEGKYLSVVDLEITDPGQEIVDVTYLDYRSAYLSQKLRQWEVSEIGQDLDEKYGQKPTLMNQINAFINEKDSIDHYLEIATNISRYKSVGMRKTMAFDQPMQAAIDMVLATADSIRSTVVTK
jgi:2',3'-cyclic-nucleotide 2'-phosphodiesterase (5'-nucleotidase family)